MDYIKNFTDTIKTWWKFKNLWVIGIIGTVLAQFGSMSQGFSYMTDKDASGSEATTILMVIGALVIAALSIIISIVSVYMQYRTDSSLIQSASFVNDGKDLSVKELWALGGNYKMKLFIASILISIPAIVLILIMSLLLLIAVASFAVPPVMIALFIVVFFLFLVLLVILAYASAIRVFSSRLIVLENKESIESIKLAFALVNRSIKHITISYLLALVASTVTTSVLFPFATILFVILAPILAIISLMPVVGVILVFIIQLILAVLSSLFTGPISAFMNLYWTNTYLEIRKLKD